MDNSPEGENKQFQHTWPSHHEPTFSAPPDPSPETVRPAEAGPPSFPQTVPSPIVSTPEPVSPPNPTNPQPAGGAHITTTLILQWLTYAFWGWTVLALSALTISVFQRLIAGTDPSNFNYYVIAGLAVLLPISFVCDKFYSKQEPDKKTGSASLIMVVHAVIFALFTIASLLFAAWSVVGIATDSIDRSTHTSDLVAALFIGVFYAAIFMRTLNPTHRRWAPRIFRLAAVAVIAIFVILGFTRPTFHSDPTVKSSTGEQLNTKGTRRPAQYLHICTTSKDITYVSQGSPKCLGNDAYQSDYDPSVPGLLYSSPCKTTSGTQRYVYIAENESCPSDTKLVFYNNVCPTDAESSDDCTGSQSDSDSEPTGATPSNNFGSNGKLEPSVVGGTQCDIPTLDDGSSTGQVALAGGATCDEAEASIQSANGKKGGNYTANGYACTSTKQGASTQWSDYWDNNFFSYNCTSGSKQTAFNLQTADQGQSSPTLTD
jgi:hypothetical protein